jgi:hypothetical protein
MQAMHQGLVGGAALACAAGLAIGQCGGGFAASVIYTEIPGHPTASPPGAGGQEFTALLSLYASPNGQHWIFKGFVGNAIDVIVAGSGSSGAVVALEGDATAIPGTTHSFVDSDCGINDSGQFAYGSRLLGATTLIDEVIFFFDGTQQVTAVRESDPAPGLFDPGVSGDEIFGNSLNSTHVLNNGTVAFRADLIGNIPTDYRSALYHGSVPVLQEGTQTTGGETIDSTVALSGNTFSSSADGSVWAVEADIAPGVASVEAVVVNNTVMLKDGDLLPGSALPIDAVFAVDVDDAGNWFARGDFTDDTDWVVRNGAVIAMTGQPITTGSAETWGDTLVAMNGLGGDYLVAGNTSGGGQALVLNGTTVVARQGDLIQLDGSTQVEIATFSAEDVALTDDGRVLAFVTLNDPGTGTGLGDAFVEWGLVFGCNPADLAPPCDVLDLADINAFIAGFVAQDPITDLAQPFGVWDLADVQAFAAAFVNGCP